MISREFLTELATKYQTSEQNVAREYCQHLFLSYLYQQKAGEKLLFKGGTSLRIIFRSPRFSEDLDFSTYDLSVADINVIIDEILAKLAKEGIQAKKEVNPGTEGQTSGGYYAIIHLILMEFDSEIRIQVSLRSKEELKSNSVLIENDFITPYTIIYLDESILVREKVLALLDRAKSRDFFDLYFILRNSELVKFVPKDILGLKEKIYDVLVNGWEKELKVFLPVSHQALLKDFQDRLKREIETHIG